MSWRAVWQKYAYSFCWQKEVKTCLKEKQILGNVCRISCGTENDKHDNHEIIKIKRTQENAGKHQS
jgi:hypothetical protein